MPWPNGKSITRYTKKANTPKKQDQWQAVANSVLSKTGDDAQAIRTANGAIKKRPAKGGPPSMGSY